MIANIVFFLTAVVTCGINIGVFYTMDVLVDFFDDKGKLSFPELLSAFGVVVISAIEAAVGNYVGKLEWVPATLGVVVVIALPAILYYVVRRLTCGDD